MRFFRQTLLLVCLGLPCALLAQPLANDDTFATAEDTQITYDLVANDTDPDFSIDPTTVDLDISTPLVIDNSITTAEGTFTVSAAGVLTFDPALNFFGAIALQYTVNNTNPIPVTSGPGNIAIDVNAVNDAPLISLLTDIAVDQNTTSLASSFTVSDVDNAIGSLNVTGTSDNLPLIPVAGINLVQVSGGDWTVSVTPAAGLSGTATVTLTVSDGALMTQGTFAVTVNPPPNTNPTISAITNQNINEDSFTPSIPFTIGDAETPAASLTLSTASSDISIIPLTGIAITGTGANLNLVITPEPDKFGTVTISITVADAEGAMATEDLDIVIASVNDLPVVSAISNQAVNEDGATGSLNFTISDIETPATALSVTPFSSDLVLVPLSNIVITGTGGSRDVVVTPAANLSGSVNITLTVTDADGGATAIPFSVTIDPVDDAPAISVLSDIVLNQNGSSPATPFSVTDIDTPLASLNVTATSSDETLLPVAGINLTQLAAVNWTVIVTPALAQIGTSTVTLTVSDGTQTSQGTFVVTVNAIPNTNPTISAISDQIINEDAATTSLAFTIADAETPVGSLTLTAASSNTLIIPLSGIVVTGAAGIRNVVVTPAANQFGTVTITLMVDDADGGTATEVFDVAIASVNDVPVISAIANQIINEDNATALLNFTVSDTETAAASLNVVANSSNTTLVPLSNILVSGVAGSRSVIVTPSPDLSGVVVITLLVEDTDGGTTPSTFQVTINAINDAPTITTVADEVINEDGQTSVLNFTVGDLETPGTLTMTAVSSNTALVNSGGIVLTGTGAARTVRVTPLPNQFGTTLVTLRVSDGIIITQTAFQVIVDPVDDIPTITPIADQLINENSQTGPLSFTIGDVETSASLLTLIPASSNLTLVDNTDVVFGGSGSLRMVNVKPKINQFGTATITLTVSDGAQSAQSNFLLTVASVDAPPTITPIADFAINEDVASGAFSFTVGDPDSPIVDLNVAGVSDNPALIANANITLVEGLAGVWTVQVTPTANASGLANITLTVTDDASEMATTSFNVTVTPVNDLPTMTAVTNKITDEDTPAAAFNVTLTDIETPAASLVVTGISDNPTLIPNANIAITPSTATPTITITPALNQNGVANITLTVTDANGGTFDRVFSVTVNPINDAPTVTLISNQIILEDQVGGTGLLDFTINDVDGNPLTVTRTSDDLTLVPLANAVLGGTGANRTVTVTPALNQFGIATITINVSDGTLIATTSFTVSVTSVNDLPTVSTVANQNIDEGTSTGVLSFTVGDVETVAASLIVTSSSSNTTLIPLANVVLGGAGAARTVAITPAPGQNGASTITLSVNDGTVTESSTFIVTVASVDDPPTITPIAAQSTNEDVASVPIAFTVGDPDTPVASLTLTGTSSNTTAVPNGNIVFGGTGANRTVTITPAANQNGSSTITVDVSDASTSVSTSFILTVVPVNDAPTIGAIANQVTNEDTPTSDISFTVGDLETATASLTVTAVSSNVALVPDANIVLGGTGAARTVAITPAPNLSGVSSITITVSDGVAMATRTFQVTVSDVNDAPTITAIADQAVPEDTNTGAISFTIGDIETPVGSLTLTKSSTNTTLIPLNNIVIGGTGAARTVTVTPANNQNGTSTISLTVDDGTTSTTIDFQIVVTPVDDAPALATIGPRIIPEDTDTGNINFTISDPETVNTALVVTATSSDIAIVPDANITLGGTAGTRTIKVAPAPDMNGVVTITVSVTDGVNTTTKTFTVTITPVNDVPVISGQQALSISEGQQLLLALSQLTIVDPDNTVAQLTLFVTGGSNYAITGANTITPNAAFNGTLSVPVFVGDGSGYSVPYNMSISVTSTNDPPVVAAQSPLVTNEDQAITLQPSNFTITDLDGDTNFTLILSAGSNYTFTGTTVTPDPNYNGVIFVGVKANDGQVNSTAVFNAQITVNPVNDPPTVTAQSTLTMSEETSLTLLVGNFTITDPEPTSYTLSVLPPAPGANYTLSGNTITPIANYFGPLTVPITVSDGFANSAAFDVTVTVTDVNDAPVIASQNSLSTVEDIPITLLLTDLNVTDVDDANYPTSFALNVFAGTDYTFNGTTITPTLDFNGILNINVQVRDPRGANSATFVVHVTVTDDADAPVINGQNAITMFEDDSRVITLADIDDQDADTPEASRQLFVLAGANYTVSNSTTITPSPNFFGTLSVGVRVYDGAAYSNTWPLQITVSNVNDPPSFNPVAGLTILEDAALQTITITGISAGPLETEDLYFTFVSDNTSLIKAPAETPMYNHQAPNNTITFKPEPNASGTANITVSLFDGPTPVTSIFTITVTPVNDAPTLMAISTMTILEDVAELIVPLAGITPGGGTPEVDQKLKIIVSVDNQIVEPITYDYVQLQSTGSLRIKPKPNANGTTNVTVRIEDDGTVSPAPNVNFVTRTFILNITPVNDVPVITSTAQSQAEPGVPYVYQIEVRDDDGDPITITAPSLPAWLTLTQVSNGVATLTGTPPAGASGDFNIALFVSDPEDAGNPKDGSYTLIVNSRPIIVDINASADEDVALAYTTANFQAGFTDPDGNSIAKIQILGLPRYGQLTKADNAPVLVGDEFTVADISKLTYVSNHNYNGRDTINWNGADGFNAYGLLPARVLITVAAVNDVPEVRLEPTTDTLKYQLGTDIPVPLTETFDAEDPDGDLITNAEVAFKRIDNFDYTTLHDYLVFTRTAKIDGTFDAASGSLRLTGNATATEYVAAIRSIKYNYIDVKELELDLRSVTFTLSDGKLSNQPESRIIKPIYTFRDLNIPSAFTPNEGDNVNQTWEIKSPNGTALYNNAVVKVYNKHGVLLWHAKGFDNPWNGVYDGSLLPSDTYFYTIDLNFNKIRYKGTVTILR